MISCDPADNLTWGSNCILEAAMRFENGNIKWFVEFFAYDEYENQECYFIAEKAQYKIELT